MDLLRRTKEASREVKVAIYVIVAISVLAFLLYEVRKHAVEQLTLERTRIEAAERQFSTVIASVSSERFRVGPPLVDGVAYIEDGRDNYLLWLDREGIHTRRESLPGYSSGKVETHGNDDSGTVTVMSTGIETKRLAVVTRAVLGERADRLPWNMVATDQRFVLRGGRIVFVEHDAQSRTSVFFMAPLEMLLAGLPWALSAEIAVVGMLAFLLILIQESRTNENNIRRLLDASPVPLAMFDLASRDIVLANTAARELFGSAAHGLPQAVVRQGFLRNPELLRRITGDASSIKALEWRILRADGVERWVAVSAERINLHGRPSMIVGISDITERQQAEETLRVAKNAAEAANRAKSEFLAMVSHELRTPINGILGLSQLLEDLPLHERARQLVSQIRQSGGMLATIIGDILDIATFEVGRLKIHSRPFDLRETVLGPVSVASTAAAAKGIKVRVSIDDALPPKLVGDPNRLQQIINNLVSNSVKFTAEGEIAVEVRPVGEDAHSIQVEVVVADSGIGIPPEAQDKIFQPFWQGEEGVRRQFGGIGLGLSICKRLIEAMNGSLGFSSEPGRGSSFWFRLRFDRATSEKMPELLNIPKLRILVADDVPLNLEVAANLIRSEGHDVTAVASGEEAVSRALCEMFDLLVIDIRMPGVDGLTAARRIRAGLERAGRSVPILGLTANLIPTDLPLYRVCGIDEIVEKPIDRAQLSAAIHRWAKGGAAFTSARSTAETVVPTQRIAEMAAKLGPERAARIVELFLDTAQEAVETIGYRCAALAFEDVGEAAHKLAGAASNVGYADLAERTRALEHAARQNDVRAASELAMRVITFYQQAAAHANEMLATPRPAA